MVKRIIFKNNCFGCGQCLEVCPHDALYPVGYTIKHDSNKCISCGRCLEIECSGDCFHMATIDTISEIKPHAELPEQSGEV